MQRNKYLENLGIKPEVYAVNLVSDDDPRNERFQKQREDYGFDESETWSLDSAFVEWLYSRLKMFMERADGFIDLSHYKFQFKGKEINQRDAINYIIDVLEQWLMDEDKSFSSGNNDRLIEAVKLFADILPAMWW